MVQSLFSATSTQRILTFLAERPSETFFEKQIAEASGVSLGAAHAAVHYLASGGLLRTERKGKRCFYAADLTQPLVRQWKVLATLVRLEPLLAQLRTVCERIVLFGSCATGTNHEDSDVDLYVRTAQPDEARRIVESSPQADRIQLVARTVLEEVEAERSSPVFLENVRRGLVLYDEGAGF